MAYPIACKYCDATGTHADVHKGGWSLARNHPFAYVCPKCQCKESSQ